MKEYTTYGVIGIICGFISNLFGGWSTALTTLIIFMAIDFITGLMVAGIFKNSTKTKTGALGSRTCWKGLCQKGVTLLIVLVASRLDLMMNSNFIRDCVVIAFVCNEAISIIENSGLMGVPIPKALIDAIDVLKQKDVKSGDNNDDESATKE